MSAVALAKEDATLDNTRCLRLYVSSLTKPKNSVKSNQRGDIMLTVSRFNLKKITIVILVVAFLLALFGYLQQRRLIGLYLEQVSSIAQDRFGTPADKGKGEGEKIHEEIMTEEELSRAVELDNLYAVFPSIDYSHIVSKYKNAKAIRDPVIASNNGKHISEREIKKLLEDLESQNVKSFTD